MTCGNCRRVIDDIQPEVVLETDEEMEEDDNDEEYQLTAGANDRLVRMDRELERYRSEGRPYHCHHEDRTCGMICRMPSTPALGHVIIPLSEIS